MIVMKTRPTLLPLLLASALAGACGGIENGSSEGAPASSTTPPGTGTATDPAVPPHTGTTGVTEDGETVVFAGTHPAPTTVPGERPIDREHLIMTPNAPDPNANWSLDDALVGLPIDGDLIVEIQTDLGVMMCELFPDRAPHTVAAFVGLARGRRAWWDARAGQWVTRVYYRNTSFFRVIPGYIIQGGDYLGDGSGRLGFTVPLERSETLSHDRAGRLAMATFDGDPNSGGGQFYITDGPHQDLDGTATIFGQCSPDYVVSQIARVVQTGAPENRPLTPVHMGLVYVRRVVGGVAQAHVTVPGQPEGEPEVGRGASAGPSDIERGRAILQRDDEAAADRRRLGLPPVPPRPPQP
jgi:peptidyl-prolyl cis-trans isomerase A (cyclophilin A)